MKRYLYYILLTQLLNYLPAIFLVNSYTLYAQWSTGPANNLIVGYGLLPEACSDSAGGCYITYEQNLTYPRQLILERLNRYGYKPWSGSKQITGLLEEQSSAKIVEDGCGGIIISYLDIYYNFDPYNPIFFNRLRVQRVDSSGNFLWGPNGVRVSLSETNQANQSIIYDRHSGCITSWLDTMNNLRVQRVDMTGSRAWGDSGIFLGNASAYTPIYEDGHGGCYVLFEYFYLQKIDSNGTKYWPNQGLRIPTGMVGLSRDFSDNIYLFGGKFIGYNGSVNVWTSNLQKLNSTGSFLWDSSGIIIDTIYERGLLGNRIITMNNGISFLAWDNIKNTMRRVFGQIVSSSGIPLTNEPFTVSLWSADEWTPEIIVSDSQSVIYMRRDYYQNPSRIYIQRFNSSGGKIWDTMNVTATIPALSYERITTDCQGGCIIVGFHDDFSIRVQQVSKNGKLGEVITNIEDYKAAAPEKFFLYQNYPNPFNSLTVISYDLPKITQVKLEVYNLIGEKIKTLADIIQGAGTYNINFDASNLPSGLYFYKLKADDYLTVRKLLIIK